MGDAYMATTAVQFRRDSSDAAVSRVIWARVHQTMEPAPFMPGYQQKATYHFFVDKRELAYLYPDGAGVHQRDTILCPDVLSEEVAVSSILPVPERDEESEIRCTVNL